MTHIDKDRLDRRITALCVLLFFTLLTLRLMGEIDLSYALVTAPVWGLLLFAVLTVAVDAIRECL